MRILVVGNGNFKHRGQRYYDPVHKLINGLIRNGHNIYFMSDRDEARSKSRWGKGLFGRGRASAHVDKVFLDICRNFKPQAIFCFHADLISVDALIEARRILPEVRIGQFNVDIIFNIGNVERISSKLDGVDATFLTTAGPGLRKFSRPGKAVCFVPNMVDPSLEWPRGFERSDQAHDMFWALRAVKGSVPGDRRIDFPLYLQQHGVDIDFYGMENKPLLFDARYFEAIAECKMGLNISQIWTRGNYNKAADEDIYLYSSDRIAHYTGSGLLVFTTRDHKLEELFAENREMVFFDSKEELLEKIRYYSTHDEERRAIAKAGWEKSMRAFNERIVSQFMLEVTLGVPLSQAYAWPTEKY